MEAIVSAIHRFFPRWIDWEERACSTQSRRRALKKLGDTFPRANTGGVLSQCGFEPWERDDGLQPRKASYWPRSGPRL